MVGELENELPSKVMDNMTDNALTVEQLLSQIGNLTAAQNETIFKVLQKMAAEGELEVGKKGGGKKKVSTIVEVSDTLIRPSQRTLFSKYR